MDFGALSSVTCPHQRCNLTCCANVACNRLLPWTRAASARFRRSAHRSRAAISISSGQQQPVDVLRRRYHRPARAAWLSRGFHRWTRNVLCWHRLVLRIGQPPSLQLLVDGRQPGDAAQHACHPEREIAAPRRDMQRFAPQLPARCKKVWRCSRRSALSRAFWARVCGSFFAYSLRIM